MEKLAHCVVHRKRPAEYVCSACENLPLCEICKPEHVNETGHASKNYKELALAFMRQRIEDAGEKQTNELANEMREVVKELDATLLREINRFQLSCATTVNGRKMRKIH